MRLGMVLLSALFLTACSSLSAKLTGSSASSASSVDTMLTDEWGTYVNDEFGVSFGLPLSFQAAEPEDGEISIGPYVIVIRQAALFHPSGTQVTLIQTKRRNIMDYVEQYQPAEPITVNAHQLKKYAFTGLGNTVGYVLREKPDYVLLEFTFPPSQQVIDRILASLQTRYTP